MSKGEGHDRAGQLIASLRRHFEEDGFAHQTREELDDLGVGVDEWRHAARKAGRQLGRPVQTLASASMVWAGLRDWPASDKERRRRYAQLRSLVRFAS